MTEGVPPRLAFLHEDPHQWGGGEVVLQHLSRLASAHAPVDLGLLFGCSGTAGDSNPWSHFSRMRTFDFPSRLRWSDVTALARNQRALRRWLQEAKVSACVAMTYATAFRAALAMAGTGTPLAWLCTFSVRVQGRRRMLMRSAALRGLGLSGALAICPSLTARDELAELGYPADRLRVISFGVEVERFQVLRLNAEERRQFRQSHGIPEDDVVVLYAARLDPVKNHDVLLRAVAAAGRRGARVALVCLGDASADHVAYAAGLRVRASALGVADRVLFAGRQSDVPAWLAAADIAVLSSHTETAGLALIEGAAAGLPLLSSRVGSAPEIVIPGRSGYLFDAADAETCAGHLVTLAGSEAHRRALGTEARRLAEPFDIRHTDRQWLGLFAELLKLGPPTGGASPGDARSTAWEVTA